MTVKKVLYLAENAISSIQGGGIVVYNVLKGLPPENLLGFFQYRNITPVPEYGNRFHYLGTDRVPELFRPILHKREYIDNFLRTFLFDKNLKMDLEFVVWKTREENFMPGIVYFSGLSLRFLRLAVMAAEYFDVPMVVLHMDDWMEVEKHRFKRWGNIWYRRIIENMTEAAKRSLASTTNSPSLSEKVTRLTGYKHKPANNCCEDLMELVSEPIEADNEIPVLTYAGALNWHLQGETLIFLTGAIAELNAEGTPVHLHVYTPWEFAHMVNANEIPDAVYYKGHVNKNRLPEIYLKSDFLVSSVTFRRHNLHLFRHSLSTKLSEYLCVGKPVLSIGHLEWHLHEYVQQHKCGFSIYMDENYQRAKIKEELKAMLATPKSELAEIGKRNRLLWEEAHDVKKMASETRSAIGLDPF
ncbi:MAG: hypothetical protein JXR80_08985 [Deltaproteobacteria bacterium]|nr:hypothetical protein [Deltaproteobacteria bacterium]